MVSGDHGTDVGGNIRIRGSMRCGEGRVLKYCSKCLKERRKSSLNKSRDG